MIKNFFRTAWRSLYRHPSFTAITVVGLALGMSACLLILTFVWDQSSYDDFHTAGPSVYRILSDGTAPRRDVRHLAASPAPLAEEVSRQVPGIDATARIAQIRTLAVVDGNGVGLEGLYAEPSFFELFDFEVDGGDGQQILSTPFQLVLTPEAARTLFGDADPIGKTVQLEGHGDFNVGGLLAEPPGNSHLKFAMLASFASQESNGRAEELADWDNSWRFATYLLIRDPSAVERLRGALPGIAEAHYAGKEEQLTFHVQALRDIALGPVLGNEISSYSVPALVVYFLSALGLLIMLTAGFNYVGLSVARAIRRAPEVGVRKVMGASRRQVVIQFLSEAVMLALGALIVGYGFLAWLVPAFNNLSFVQLASAQITFGNLADPRLLGVFVLFAVVCGLAAGMYPALLLSRYSPIEVLKSLKTVKGFSGRFLRNGLIGIQFGLALFFVVTTAFLFAQVDHLRTAEYGFESENILNLRLQGQSAELLRTEILRSPAVSAVSATSKLPASGSVERVAARTLDMDEPEDLFVYSVDHAFRENLGLELRAGRDFSLAFTTDASQSIILNEAALTELGLGTPASAVGSVVQLGDEAGDYRVVGVVQDYHYNTLMDPLQGMVWRFAPESFQDLNVKVVPGATDQAEAHISAVWDQLGTSHPISVERFETQLRYGPMNQGLGDFSALIALMALLAIIVSCLGLLGMAAYASQTRVKEVGLRKALGASTGGVVLMLSRGFLILISVASLVTLPVVWLATDAWLQIFASRVPLSPWIFLGATLATILLAMAAVASQTFRAASVNPIESLRYE